MKKLSRRVGSSKGKRKIDATDDKEYSGNVVTLLKESASFVKSNSKKAWKIQGLNRIEFIDYPEDAVREAIVNALVHRDYGIVGSEIHIDIYDDRLEIISPGGMYDGTNIQEGDIDTIASIRRNPILADILNRIDYMERRGSGLKRIRESFQDESLLEFYSNQSSFIVIMKKQIHNATEEIEINQSKERIKSGLNDTEVLIIDHLIEKQQITNREIVELTGLSSTWIRKIFVELQDKGVIEAHGAGRGRYYKLIK